MNGTAVHAGKSRALCKKDMYTKRTIVSRIRSSPDHRLGFGHLATQAGAPFRRHLFVLKRGYKEITSGIKLGTYFAFSPDGRRLAYIAGKNPVDACTCAPWIVSREMNLRVLSLGSTPFFSPDGNWVGFDTPTVFNKDTSNWRDDS